MYVLDRLWRGGYSPADRTLTPGGEYRKALGKMCKEMEKFTALLSPEASEQLEALRVLHDDITIIRDTDTFIEGFRLGARVVLDVVGEYEGQHSTAFGE